MPITHPFITAIPDDPASAAAGVVLPSHWNAAHNVAITVDEIDATGTASATTFLRGDGAWAEPAGGSSGGSGGAVDSVNGQTGVVLLDAASVGAATAAQGVKADTAVQPASLATVATSGAYSDLSGTPSAYLLPSASTIARGGVKVDGTTITIVGDVISASGGGSGGGSFGNLDGGTPTSIYGGIAAINGGTP